MNTERAWQELTPHEKRQIRAILKCIEENFGARVADVLLPNDFHLIRKFVGLPPGGQA